MRPEESIDIISRMVSDTRRSVLRHAYIPFLIWGGVTVFVSLLIYALLVITGNPYSNLCWYFIPIVGFPMTMVYRPRTKLIRTGIATSLRSIWYMLTVLLVCFSLASFFISFNILFFILLLLSIGSYVSGAVISYPFLTYSSVAGFIFSVGLLVISGVNQIPVFAAAIVVMMIMPGLKMKQDLRNL
ncbi:MAG: hypothetical protein HDR88_07290 [Bacteroides sp.]|nr:hypothetical protein [Bacteroides sp.]